MIKIAKKYYKIVIEIDSSNVVYYEKVCEEIFEKLKVKYSKILKIEEIYSKKDKLREGIIYS